MSRPRKVISYSVAIGIINFVFTGLIVFIASTTPFYTFTWKLFAQSYAIGYVILWILNMNVVRE